MYSRYDYNKSSFASISPFMFFFAIENIKNSDKIRRRACWRKIAFLGKENIPLPNDSIFARDSHKDTYYARKVWVTASFRGSPVLFSAFWPISTIL